MYLVLEEDDTLAIELKKRKGPVKLLHDQILYHGVIVNYIMIIPENGFRGKRPTKEEVYEIEMRSIIEKLEDLPQMRFDVSELSHLEVYGGSRMNLDPAYAIPVNANELFEFNRGRHIYNSLNVKTARRSDYQRFIYVRKNEILDRLKRENDLDAIGRFYCLCEETIREAEKNWSDMTLNN